jgi:hypothetical protein
MIPLWKGKNPIYFGVKGQGHSYYKYNFWQQDRFRTISLVLYIGSLPNLATWFPCGRGRTLFILGSLPLYSLIIYIDGRILWCTHFLFNYWLTLNILSLVLHNCIYQMHFSLTQHSKKFSYPTISNDLKLDDTEYKCVDLIGHTSWSSH